MASSERGSFRSSLVEREADFRSTGVRLKSAASDALKNAEHESSAPSSSRQPV